MCKYDRVGFSITDRIFLESECLEHLLGPLTHFSKFSGEMKE